MNDALKNAISHEQSQLNALSYTLQHNAKIIRLSNIDKSIHIVTTHTQKTMLHLLNIHVQSAKISACCNSDFYAVKTIKQASSHGNLT